MPNATFVAPVKPLPVMVTMVPPSVVPVGGEIPVTLGTGALWLVEALRLVELPIEVEHPAITTVNAATSANGPHACHDLV